MAIEKTLLLKGLAGVAAVGGVGGVAIAHKSGSFKSKKVVDEAKVPKAQENLEDEDKKKAKKESVNSKLTTLGLESCLLGDNEVTSPTTFSKDCELTKDQFQKIKFSNKPETGNVTVDGWTGGTNKIKLKIENKQGDENGIKFLFKEHPSNLIVKGGDSQDNKFSIRSGKDTEFEEREDKLSKKVDSNIQNKLKGYNQKFESLKLPTSCSFDTTEADTSLECSITKEQLKSIKFSNKGEDELTVDGLGDSQKVKLTIERNTSTETLKYKFKNENNSNITVTGTTGDQTKFSIRTNKETEFEESNNKLSKKIDSDLSTRLKGYNTKFQTLSLPEVCRFDDTESDTSFECEMDQDKFKRIKFSNKDENNDLTVKGWTGDNKITLKVEEKEDKSGVKYLFKNIKDNLTITRSESEQTEKFTLKTGVEKEFEEKNSKLSKVVDGTLSAKLKKFNENLGSLGIPAGCRFDETESDEKLECSISETQIKTIKFWNKGEGDLTISSGGGFTSLKLALSVNGDELKYVFKDANRNIKLSQDSKTFTLKEYADNEFEFKDEVLRRPRKIEEVAGKVNLTCTYEENSKGNNGSCALSEGSSHITVSSDGTTPVSLQFGPNSNLKDKKNKVKFDFSEYEYEDNYENNVKFTFKEDTLDDGNGGKLENNANYEVKKVGVSDCLSKKVPQ